LAAARSEPPIHPDKWLPYAAVPFAAAALVALFLVAWVLDARW